MQYIFLKNILETILTNYTCPHCNNKATEQSLTVTAVREKSVNVHVQCHVCGTQSELNAEVNPTAAQMLETKEGRLQFEEFLKSG
jgi:transcription elongation factor Elf1